jgi:uncharacterized protein with HEPN domain
MCDRRDQATLADIAAAAERVLDFVAGMDEQAFLADRKTVSAVLHEVTVIGEAVKRLSPAFTEAHPEIPWRAVARMRDRLIHGYDRVDLQIVWQTTQESIPQLLRALEALLSSDPPEF